LFVINYIATFRCGSCGKDTSPQYVRELEERMEEEMERIKDGDITGYQVDRRKEEEMGRFNERNITVYQVDRKMEEEMEKIKERNVTG
jgi:hypothetical protein